MLRRNALPVRPPPPDLTLAEILSHFPTDEKARQYLEAVRWLDGRCCPHCGNANQTRIHAIKANKPKKVRDGLYECGECRDQFTVTVGTVFHGSKVPAPEVAGRLLPALLFQDVVLSAPTPAGTRTRQLPHGLVHVPPHPLRARR